MAMNYSSHRAVSHSACGVGSPSHARIRLVHAVADGPAVDVYVDSKLVVKGLSYGHDSGYLHLNAGRREIGVAVVDTTNFVKKMVADLHASVPSTFIVHGFVKTPHILLASSRLLTEQTVQSRENRKSVSSTLPQVLRLSTF